MKLRYFIGVLILLFGPLFSYSQKIELPKDSLRVIPKRLLIGEDEKFIYSRVIVGADYSASGSIGYVSKEYFKIVKIEKETQKIVDESYDRIAFHGKNPRTFLLNRKTIVSCYYFSDATNEKQSGFLLIRDTKDLKNIKKIDLLNKHSYNKQLYFVLSPDSSKFAVVASDEIKKHKDDFSPAKIFVNVMDDNATIIWEGEQELKGGYETYLVLNPLLTNEGVVFFQEKLFHINRDVKTKTERGVDLRAYDLFLGRMDKNSLKYIDIDLKNWFIPVLTSTVVENSLILSDLYQEKEDGGSKGLYYLIVDLKEFRIKKKNAISFTTNWSTSLRPSLLTNEKDAQYPDLIALFNVYNVKYRQDGTLLFFCEAAESNFGFLSSADLILLGVSTKGDLSFTTVIPKWIERSADTQPHYSYIDENTIYLFYIDHKKNILLENPLKKLRAVYDFQKYNIVMARIDRNGNYTRTLVLSSQKSKKFTRLDYMKKRNEKSIEFCTPPLLYKKQGAYMKSSVMRIIFD